jgi:hypothetical protein
MRERTLIEEPIEPLDETRRRRRIVRERFEEGLGAEAIPPAPPTPPTPTPPTPAPAERLFTFSSVDVPALAGKKVGDRVTFEITAEITNVRDNMFTMRLIEAVEKKPRHRRITTPARLTEEVETEEVGTQPTEAELLRQALQE